MRRELLVLTCNIKPQNSTAIQRSDYLIRLDDYRKALKKWIDFTQAKDMDLLIVENSDSLDLLKSEFPTLKHDVIFKQLNMDLKSHLEGISSGEFEMLKGGLTEDCLNHYDFIWKASGRNFVTNAAQVFERKKEADLVCDRTFFPRHSCESRLFGMKTGLWSKFLELRPIFRPNGFDVTDLAVFDSMEHLLTVFAANIEFAGQIQLPFNQPPLFEGFSGSTNKMITSWKRRLLLKIKKPFRSLIHKMLLGVAP